MPQATFFWVVWLVLAILSVVLYWRTSAPENRYGAFGMLALFALTGLLGWAIHGPVLR